MCKIIRLTRLYQYWKVDCLVLSSLLDTSKSVRVGCTGFSELLAFCLYEIEVKCCFTHLCEQSSHEKVREVYSFGV
ncbi:hypothetical protein NRI_0564 [Neorickettsia risticii str. Illinois]|uniref:Uncharacterized protein n=1 Tax=Neorickettsia risticii (strain Illinois) TaxID=434131 RepID=C6V575_NEORI|nr:hypothetical protein NRI_0564 [Neorickettsia risticii str. Illinois]